ncbi:MAG: AMP-binding protein [Bifidobacteriaceae bacterium]|nr:AMP-binding protein [Bifidobacteriaceae bacterium]
MAAGLGALGLVRDPFGLARFLFAALPRDGLTIAGALAGGAHAWGDRVALIDDRGPATYRELDGMAGGWANGIVRRGLVRRGGRVALACWDDREFLVAMAAATRVGAHLAVLDPRGDLADQLRPLEARGVDLLIHSPDLAGRWSPGSGASVSTATLREWERAGGREPPQAARPGVAFRAPAHGEGGLAARLASLGAEPPNRGTGEARVGRRRGGRLALLTSGTTGAPKAVNVADRAARALAGLALAGATGVRAGRPTLVWPPLCHGYGLAMAALCLISGSPMVLQSALAAELTSRGQDAAEKGGPCSARAGRPAPADASDLAGRNSLGRDSLGSGLAGPSLVGPGLVGPGLAGAGLVGPGIVGPGLAEPDSAAAARAARAQAKSQAALNAIRRYGISVVAAVPAQLGFLAAYLNTPGAPDAVGERVNVVVTGGDPMDAATAATIQRRWGRVLVNYYGSTETGTLTVAVGADLALDPTNVGRPCVGARVEVVGEDGKPLPVGQTGRVRAQSLLAAPDELRGGRTVTLNDLAWMDQSGNLHISGRVPPN